MMRTAVLALAVCASVAAADDPAGGYEVDDVLVLEGSAHAAGLNARGRYSSTLPRSLAGRRAVGEGDGPMPAGVIAFSGEGGERVDVLLEYSGRAVASVLPAGVRRGRLLWSGLTLGDEPPGPLAAALPAEHWLEGVRAAAEGLTVRTGTAAERVLLYDVELDASPEVGLAVEGDAWRVLNRGRRPVSAAAALRPAGEGRWRLGVAGDVPAAPDEKPAEEPEDGETKVDEDSVGARVVSAAVDAAKEAAGMPAAKPKPKEGPAAEAALTFGEPLSAEEAAAAYADLLPGVTGAGRAHLEAVVRSRLSADAALLAYRLAPDEHARLMPIEVTPAAAAVRRTAVVLVPDADPSIGDRVEALVAQLGDDAWARREAATAQLRQLGRAAEPALKAALTNEDPEIADRAKRLVDELKP